MIAPRKRNPIKRSGLTTWTEEEYRAILHAAGSQSRAAFIRNTLLNRRKLAALVEQYRNSKNAAQN